MRVLTRPVRMPVSDIAWFGRMVLDALDADYVEPGEEFVIGKPPPIMRLNPAEGGPVPQPDAGRTGS